MDPYNVLGISQASTKDQIRKAYLKLVLKYHPDKCKEDDSEEKIRSIHMAYELLKNDEYKQKYDSLNSSFDKNEYYTEFKKYITSKYPNFKNLFDNIIRVFYENENVLKEDFNNFDFIKIYDTITNKLLSDPEIVNDINIFKNKNNIDSTQDTNHPELNIYGTVYSTLKNRYNNKYEKIVCNRITKDPKILFIPLRENKIIFQNEGESYKNVNGDIIINVVIANDDNFTFINNDIYVNYEISLYEYLYGGKIEIKYIDDSFISINYDGMIYNMPFITLDDKGLPYYEDEILKRGKLIINLKINGIETDEFKQKIKNIY